MSKVGRLSSSGPKRCIATAGAAALSLAAGVTLAPSASASEHVQDLVAACTGLTGDQGFTDISGFPAQTQAAINCLSSYEITQGRSATQYAPRDTVNRYEMALFLDRLLDYVDANSDLTIPNEAADAGFEDLEGVPADAVAAINRLAGLEVAEGYTETQYRPYQPVLRRQMASFLDRIQDLVAEQAGADAAYDGFDAEASFADVPVTHPQAEDIYSLEGAGIVQGTGDRVFSPNAAVTRAQMAFFLLRHLNENIRGMRVGTLATDATLRSVAPEGFFIGTAVAGGGHHEDQPYPDPFPNDEEYREILAAEFNSVSPENQMKWEFIHPEPDVYNFAPADAIVAFAEENDQVVRGHTLLWHSQNPTWLEEGDHTPEQLREILREHITTVVGRYAGQIQQWDVANEVFDDEGNLRSETNIWLRELGPGIIADAFRWAHEADPQAQLFFNDYNVEGVNAKSTAYYELIQDLLADGVPVHGFSTQGHLSTRYGFPGDLQENLERFDDLGLETAITEVDVRMDLPESGTPTEAQLEQQADYYQQALEACLAVEDCNSFTVWGFTDKYSWVPVFFPTEGSATIMTEGFERKPAYYALQSSLVRAAQ